MSIADSTVRTFPREHRVDSLDVTVTPSTVDDIVATVSAAAEAGDAVLIGAHNLHSVYLHHTDEDFRRFYEEAEVVLVDGWPILAAVNRERSRDRLPELPFNYRIGSTDWVPEAMQSQAVTRVCVIGASKEANARFIERQASTNDGVEFLGFPGDPWAPERLVDLIEMVRAFEPQLTLIGMGMPLQEEVALALRSAAVSGVIATVGGAIDQLAGVQNHAPRWTGRMKVEWLWRLATNPRRLAHRYLVEPVKLATVLRRAKQSAL